MENPEQTPSGRAPAEWKNVGDNERRASLLGGGASLLMGLRRRGVGGLLLSGLGAALLYRGASGHCPVNQRIGRNSARPTDKGLFGRRAATGPVRLYAAVTVEQPAARLYSYWRDFTNLPRFMQHLQEVTDLGGGRSHWVALLPGGRTAEWDSEVTVDETNARIGWSTLAGSQVQHDGEVRFKPAPEGRGTEVEVEMHYQPPGRTVSALGRWLSGLSEQVVQEDLRRFKRVMEAGEVPTSAMQ